jgi:choline monooxygenase
MSAEPRLHDRAAGSNPRSLRYRPAMFDIVPDITRAHTPDKRLYLDPEVFAAQREQVFARAWHWLGRLDAVAGPGSLAPLDILPGCLDEPLLLARDAAGTLRLLSNVCTHRGSLLVARPCTAAEIRCPYHSRRFALDGRLRFMPGFEGVQDFPAASDHLPALALGQAWGHGFGALAPAGHEGAAGAAGTPSTPAPLLPLVEWLGPVQQRLAWLDIAAWREDPARGRDYTFDANWALYVENYLEGLHIPFVHPGLNATLDMSGYRYETWPGGVWQIARAREGEPAFAPPPGSPEHGQRIAAYYAWLFPNLMLNVYPWGLSVNVVEPLGPARTRVRFRSFVADAARTGEGAGGALDTVEREDEAAVVAVQQGLRSRLYRHGRYAPVHELAVHHFHRLLAAALAEQAA